MWAKVYENLGDKRNAGGGFPVGELHGDRRHFDGKLSHNRKIEKEPEHDNSLIHIPKLHNLLLLSLVFLCFHICNVSIQMFSLINCGVFLNECTGGSNCAVQL